MPLNVSNTCKFAPDLMCILIKYSIIDFVIVIGIYFLQYQKHHSPKVKQFHRDGAVSLKTL